MQDKKPHGDTYTRRPAVPRGRLPPLPPNSAGFRSGAKEDVNSDDKIQRNESGRSMVIPVDPTLPQTQGEKEKLGRPGVGSKTQNKGDRP
jgi:hypothetical protein